SAEKSAKDSAQSPAWRRNALPAATSASPVRRLRASPANTSGGREANCFRARSRAASSGQSGCCAAGRSRQEEGVQLPVSTDQRLDGATAHTSPKWGCQGDLRRDVEISRASVGAAAAPTKGMIRYEICSERASTVVMRP